MKPRVLVVQPIPGSRWPCCAAWLEAARDAGDPRLFSDREAAAGDEHCADRDLILALPLHQ